MSFLLYTKVYNPQNAALPGTLPEFASYFSARQQFMDSHPEIKTVDIVNREFDDTFMTFGPGETRANTVIARCVELPDSTVVDQSTLTFDRQAPMWAELQAYNTAHDIVTSKKIVDISTCLLYTSPSPRDRS